MKDLLTATKTIPTTERANFMDTLSIIIILTWNKLIYYKLDILP